MANMLTGWVIAQCPPLPPSDPIFLDFAHPVKMSYLWSHNKIMGTAQSFGHITILNMGKALQRGMPKVHQAGISMVSVLRH